MKTMRIVIVVAAGLWALSGCKPPPPLAPDVPAAAVISSFTASEAQVAAGAQVTLSWQVKDAKSVTLSTLDGQQIAVASGANSATATVDKDTVFILSATGLGGSDSAATSVTVEKAGGAPFFAVTPAEVQAGTATTLVWNAPRATQVSISDGTTAIYTGTDASGSVEVKPGFDTTYTLDADGKTASVSVAVSPAVFAFGASTTSALPGDTVTLSWKSAGASKVTLSADGRGDLATVTDAAQILDGSFADALPATLPTDHGFVHYVLKVEKDAVAVTRTLDVYVGAEPKIASFVVPEVARLGSTFLVSWQTAQANRVELLVDGTVAYTAPTQSDVNAGSVYLNTPAQPAQVMIRVRSAQGGETTDTRLVTPIAMPAIVSFTASPSTTVANGGDAVMLDWSATDAWNVTVEGVGQFGVAHKHGAGAGTGQVEVYPGDTLQYLLTVDNGLGDIVTATVDLTVTAPAALVYSPATAPAGTLVQVTGTTVANGGEVLGMPHRAVLKNAAGEAFIDIKETGKSTNYPSGFGSTSYSFPLTPAVPTQIFGTPVGGTDINVNINGWATLEAPANSSASNDNSNGTTIGTLLRPLSLAPYFDDLMSKSDGTSQIYYQVDGEGLDRRIIIQWENVRHASAVNSSLTFQAQIYATGKIVYAYKTIQGLPPNTFPAVGVTNFDETDEVDAPDAPAEGDTFTFFGPSPFPVPYKATPDAFRAYQKVGTSYTLITSTYPVIPPNQFVITEVNLNPSVTDGQWFEVQNNTANPIDLNGWTLEFGTTPHTIASSVVLPPNGFAVFAQTPGAGDGVAVDYVYGAGGTALAAGMPLKISIAGGVYTQVAMPAGTPQPGYSWQVGPPRAGFTLASGVTQLSCAPPATATYGTNGQHGTPGTANTPCPYLAAPVSIPSAFQSLIGTGSVIAFTDSDADVKPITLSVPVLVDGAAYSTLYVGNNGWISLKPLTCTGYPCFDSGKSAPSNTGGVGFLAPLWCDQDSTGATISWQRFVPGVQANDGYTVVSWEHIHRWGWSTDDANYQVKFFDTGDIEYHFGTVVGPTGSGQTTWWEHYDGVGAYIINVNSTTPGIQSNTAWRFAAQ